MPCGAAFTWIGLPTVRLVRVSMRRTSEPLVSTTQAVPSATEIPAGSRPAMIAFWMRCACGSRRTTLLPGPDVTHTDSSPSARYWGDSPTWRGRPATSLASGSTFATVPVPEFATHTAPPPTATDPGD